MVLSRTTATSPLPPLDCAGQMTGPVVAPAAQAL